MQRAGKRKHSNVAPVESGPFSEVTETHTKRRRQSPCTTGSTKNVKKNSAVRDRYKVRQRSVQQDPSTSQEGRASNRNSSTGYKCPICLESARNNEMKCLLCYHAFHEICIDEWLRQDSRCPVCRQEAAPPQNTRQDAEPPRNARSSTALPQNSRQGTEPPRNARQSTGPSRNSRQGSRPSQNAGPPLNNQITNILTRHECPICLESTQNSETKCLPCYHAFHQACIDEWLRENRRCPVCRQEAAPPQNASPSSNNQRPTIFGVLQALPRMSNAINNVGLNNSGISMMLNSFFTRLTNYSMNFNNGGIEMTHNNGNAMILNNRGIEMRRSNGSSMILNNRGIEMRRSNGSSIILNNRGVEMRRNDGRSMILNNSRVRMISES